MKLPEDNKKSYIFTKKEETDILQFNSLNDYSLNYDNDSNELSILGINGTLNKFPDNYFYNEIIWDTKGKSLVSDLDTKINTGKKKFNVNKIEFLEKEINNIIKKMNINENDKRRLFLSNKSTYSEIEEIKYQLNPKIILKKKTKNKNLIKRKQGRNKKDDPVKANHNKYSSDNIIKAIKTKMNDSLIFFINKLINSVYANNKEKLIKILGELNNNKNKANTKFIEVIKKIDYKTIANKTNKKYNLQLLDITIGEYLSKDISPKYRIFNKDYNKNIIAKLLEDENNNELFNFIFNKIKIENWLDNFIYKKDFEIIDNDEVLKDFEINIIKENLIRIDEIENENLLEICERDKLYFHCFMLIIYNFKRFFEFKVGRKEKRNVNK